MKLHRFDPLSFVAGLIIVAIGLAFLVPEVPADVFDVLDTIGAWFWPTVLIVIGVAILAPLASWRAGDTDEEEES